MSDLGPIKIIECLFQASKALIEAVIGRGRTHVVAGRDDGLDNVWRRGEQRIVSIRSTRPSERHFLVADRHVGRGDNRLHAGQQRREVITTTSAPPGIFSRSEPQGVVPQQITVHHNRDAGPLRLGRRSLR